MDGWTHVRHVADVGVARSNLIVFVFELLELFGELLLRGEFALQLTDLLSQHTRPVVGGPQRLLVPTQRKEA